MFTESVRTLKSYRTYWYLPLFFSAIPLLGMIGVHAVFADTAAELDLVRQREPALEQSELMQKIDIAEELDLAPSDTPMADCPPRRQPGVRKITPPRVSFGTRYPPKPVHPPIKRNVIYYPPGRRVAGSSASLQPTTQSVKVIYKDIPAVGLTPEQLWERMRTVGLEKVQDMQRKITQKDQAVERQQKAIEAVQKEINTLAQQREKAGVTLQTAQDKLESVVGHLERKVYDWYGKWSRDTDPNAPLTKNYSEAKKEFERKNAQLRGKENTERKLKKGLEWLQRDRQDLQRDLDRELQRAAVSGRTR